MKTFWLRIRGEPVAKGRPRGIARARAGGALYTKMVTPAKTAEAERTLWAHFKDRYPGEDPIDEPFVLTLDFHEGTKQRAQDLDNLIKLVMDALNGHAWTDDRLCVALTASVVRGAQLPHTEVMVRTLVPSEQPDSGAVPNGLVVAG